jgi:hypothetical protein
MNIKSKLLTDKKILALLAGMLFVVFSDNVSAADFFAMITNFGTAPRVNAHLDVSGDTLAVPAGTDVLFNVFDPDGIQLAEFTLQTNTNGFVSSKDALAPNQNFFRLTNGGPALVRARMPTGITNTSAVLYQRGKGTRLVVGIPPARKVDGTPSAVGKIFPIALGEVAAAAILIANVSGSEVTVDVFLGTKGADGAGKHSIQIRNNAHARIDLTPDDQRSHIIVSATGDVIVQLMIDDGQVHGVTVIPID